MSEAVAQSVAEKDKEISVAPEAEFVQSPQAMVRPSPSPAPTLPPSSVAEAHPPLARSPLKIKTEAFPSVASAGRTTMSPAPARAALQTRASPIVARASPTRAATRAAPSVPPQARVSLTRASSITRATPFASSTAPSTARPSLDLSSSSSLSPILVLLSTLHLPHRQPRPHERSPGSDTRAYARG